MFVIIFINKSMKIFGLNLKFQTVKKLLEKNPDLTVLGLFWAGYWRFYIFLLLLMLSVYAVFFIIAALISGIGTMFGTR